MNDFGAGNRLDTKLGMPRDGGEVQANCDSHHRGDLTAVVSELRRLAQVRRFCIKGQSTADRRIEHLIVSGWDYHAGLPEAERTRLFKRAAALRIAIESDGKQPIPDYSDNWLGDELPLMVASSAAGRAVHDAQRERIEKRMEKQAKLLPVWPLIADIRGISAKTLAILVGEAPGQTRAGFGDFATKERLWKRLGLAVIDGRRQGNPGPLANSADWTRHGYKPQRRAEVYVIGDVLFRAQWRGEKDGVPAHPIGPYGEVYARRRAHTAARYEQHPDEWPLGRCHKDALRIMTKQLVEDIWRAWRRANLLVDTKVILPAADPIGADEAVPALQQAISLLPRGRRANTTLKPMPSLPAVQPSPGR